MFLDRVKIWVRAGDGGDGAATFRREAHVPRGGPDGGDGGRGGSVYLRVDAGQTTLRDFQLQAPLPGDRRRPRRRGPGGTARPATTSILDVPPGTAVYDDETGELLADLVAVGQTRDGRPRRPRRARQHALQDAPPTRRPSTPRRASPGEEGWLRLELRLIADIGLVGLPERRQVDAPRGAHRGHAEDRRLPVHDARAEPRASWTSATTDERRPTIADVPGLIEGASAGAGLGHAFLRHVERTRILVHVVDGSVARSRVGPRRHPRGAAGARPGAAREADARRVQQDRPARRRRGLAGVPARPRRPTGSTSSRSRPRTARASTRFARALADLLPDADGAGRAAGAGGRRRPPHRGDGRRLQRRRSTATASFRVRGARIERIAAQTNFDVEESAERFQRDLARLGIDAELRRAGIAAGDLVRIGGDRARVGGAALGAP